MPLRSLVVFGTALSEQFNDTRTETPGASAATNPVESWLAVTRVVFEHVSSLGQVCD